MRNARWLLANYWQSCKGKFSIKAYSNQLAREEDWLNLLNRGGPNEISTSRMKLKILEA